MKILTKPTTIILGLLISASLLLAAGPLDPGAGPGSPGTQMPSLIEIKAAIDALASNSSLNGRTPIPAYSGAGPAFTISQSGSYVLTGNITVSSSDGIRIMASSVTLDLNGFTIASTSNTLSGAGVNIDLGLASLTDVHVKNGHVRGGTVYTGSWLDAGFEWGVRAAPGTVAALSFSEIGVARCGSGIYLASSVGKVDHCKVESIHNYGINAKDVSNSVVERCGGTGILATGASDCTAETLGTDPLVVNAAIQASNVARCNATATGTAWAINGTVVTQCFASRPNATWPAINGNVVSYSVGNVNGSGIAITASTSAIGCTAGGAATISSPSKHLGTP